LVEGTIAAFRWAAAHENLLANHVDSSSAAGPVLFARAVQRPSDNLICLPSLVWCGATAALIQTLKTAAAAGVVGWMIMSLVWITTQFFEDG
jgi:hypothetical protein